MRYRTASKEPKSLLNWTYVMIIIRSGSKKEMNGKQLEEIA
jgi:hypothetical protein